MKKIITLILFTCYVLHFSWAQTGTPDGYVFFSGTEYLANSTDGTSTFNPSTCIWRGTSGSTFTNRTNYMRLRYSDVITTDDDDARNCTLRGTESGTTGGTIYGSNRYLRYTGGAWTTTNDEDDDNIHVVFAVTRYDYTLLSVAPTVNTVKTTYSFVGESGTYTHTDAQYRVAYLDYVFYNGAHHYCLNNTSNATTSAPAAETFTYTWSWETAPASGHVTLDATTGEVTYDDYFDTDTELRLKLTAQSANMTFTAYSQTLLFEDEPVNPASVSATDMTVYMGTPQTASITLAPNPCYRNLEFTSSNPNIATVNNEGRITGMAVGTTTINVKAYLLNNTDFLTTTFNVTVKDKVKTPVISIEPNTSDNCATATATITCPTDGATIHYTTDGTTPTTSSNTYSTSFSVNNGSTVKALAVKNVTGWDNSDLATLTYARPVVPTPVIEMNNGSVTFSCTEPGVTFYYTTNGSAPTTSSNEWDGDALTNLTNECTLKVIATKSCWDNSAVVSRQYIMASGIASNVVTLNDYEDHNWTYYSDSDSPVKSLYPRNVKITYYGYGDNTMTTDNNNPGTGNMTNVASTNVAVSMYESANTFVYYKTLERYVPITNLVEGTPVNRYPYELIPNPFSKRPTYGSNGTTKWRGFYGWRIKSISGGNIYNAPTGGTAYAAGNIITDEYAKLYFQPNDAGTTNNATSMTVEFEAIWARAYRVASNSNAVNTNISNNTFQTGVSYERNFLVINDGTNNNTNINNTEQKPVTVMMVEPDGSADYRLATRYINPTIIIAQNNLKFEWMNMQVSNTLSANAKNLVVGRGVKAASAANNDNLGDMAATTTNPNPTRTALSVKGLATSSNNSTNYANNVDYTIRLESGAYENVFFASNAEGYRGAVSGTATLHVRGILGNDFDRASNDNNRLVVKEAVLEGTNGGFATNNYANALRETMVLTMKSGTTGTNYNNAIYNSTYEPSPTNAFYIAVGSGKRTCGMRRFTMEGGSISCLTGGMENWGSSDNLTKEYNINKLITDIRIKNNSEIRSAAFGGPANASHFGIRRMVLTGGQVKGWLAGACNGDSDNGGQLYGTTQIYVGGDAKIGDSHTITINGSTGGNVFGAGRGRSSSITTGEVQFGTNVVIADNAYITQSVYGGGDLGYALETANVHILGGTVKGSVFGGANQKRGQSANIVMRGGLVENGIYGGCNVTGNMENDVTIQINGGQVGVDASHTANVHGGGMGYETRVLGDVLVAVGKQNANNTVEGDAVIYGDVYGGSAQGKTNGNTALTAGKTTQVTINAGTINGSVYGGGLGDATNAADVYGPVTVTVNGGKVCSTSSGALGAVFGCNNTKGSPQKSVLVNVTGGEMEYIYGGGNAAPYTVPTPISPATNFDVFHVWMSGGKVNKHVFGGGFGSNAIIKGNTEVLISGSATVKGNVYGGGNAGTVDGHTNVQIGTN